MHKSTKITPVLRKEIFKRWSSEGISQRQLAREYHVDKRVIAKIIERGKKGDFSIHKSVNKRYLKTTKIKTSRTRKKASSLTKKSRVKKKSSTNKTIVKKSLRNRGKKTKK